MENRPIDPNKGPLSLASFYKGNDSLKVLLAYLEKIPYQRLSNPENLSLTMFENCGTCSSKHAYLQVVAEEQEWSDFELKLCMYKMNPTNTPGIGNSLSENGLDYIPEAHCYVRMGEEAIDITRPGSSIEAIKEDILLEKKLEPEQIGEWKKNFHRSYIEEWVGKEKISFNPEEVWGIREACIKGITNYQANIQEASLIK